MGKLKAQYLNKKSATKLSNYRRSDEQHAAMQANADLYTGGNLSAWIIFASTMLKPQKQHLEEK